MSWQPTLTQSFLFRPLDDEEEKKFREHAQKNDPPDLKNWNIYHPVCREEWIKRGISPDALVENVEDYLQWWNSSPSVEPPMLVDMMQRYPKDTAGLRIRGADGKVFDWFIGASLDRDNHQTLLAHVEKHFPGATLLEFAIQ